MGDAEDTTRNPDTHCDHTTCLRRAVQIHRNRRVFFSPNGGATDTIVHELNFAQSEILVKAYSLTSKPIAKALVDAKKRDVNVVVVLDKSERREKYTSGDFIAHTGIPTYINDQHAIAQQDRDHRPPDLDHRIVQLHQSCRGERGEPTGNEGEQTAGGSVFQELRGAQGAFGSVWWEVIFIFQ